MNRGFRQLALAVIAALTLTADGAAASPPERDGLIERLDAIRAGIADVERAIDAGDAEAARGLVLRLYLDEFEPIEGWWGPGGRYATSDLASAVSAGEAAFHLGMPGLQRR